MQKRRSDFDVFGDGGNDVDSGAVENVWHLRNQRTRRSTGLASTAYRIFHGMDSTDSSSLPVVTDSRLCDARRRELPRPLLEREAELASLASVAYEAAEGCGSVTLIHGEAGIGKSSLVAALPQTVPVNLRLRFAYCHDLAAPRPLGPIRDLITDAGSASRLQDDMDAQSVLDLVLDTQPKRPGAVMVVIEDVHWADDATLDVLHYVVRRIAALPVALVLTYRDDVIDCRMSAESAARSGCDHYATAPGEAETTLAPCRTTAQRQQRNRCSPVICSDLRQSILGHRSPVLRRPC